MQTGTGRLVRLVTLSVLGSAAFHAHATDGLAQPADVTGDAVVAGEMVVEPPTLINLGFEWHIQGDDNRNSAVQVSYRQPERRRGQRRFRSSASSASASSWGRSSTSSPRTCSPAACSTSSRTPPTRCGS